SICVFCLCLRYLLYLHLFPTRRSSDLYGVQGGVGKVFDHRWYIGVVGFGEWGNQSSTHTDASQFLVSNATSNPATMTAATGCITDRKSTRLNSSHGSISYAVFCLKKKI